MPAAVAVPLITGAVAAGTTVAAAKMQSNSNRRAADMNAAGNRDALAFDKGIYDKDVADYDRGLGSLAGQSTVRLGDLLNRTRTPVTASGVYDSGSTAPPLMPGGMTSIAQMRSAGSGQTPAAAAAPSDGMVRMQASDGEIRAVRPEAVEKYLARGMRRVA